MVYLKVVKTKGMVYFGTFIASFATLVSPIVSLLDKSYDACHFIF